MGRERPSRAKGRIVISRRRPPRVTEGAIVIDRRDGLAYVHRRAVWRATGLRIVAFKQAPPGTTSAEFNRGGT